MALSSSPHRQPTNLKRRSTGAASATSSAGAGAGLDYYWSSNAGVGPSSSTSSLAVSPSPSAGLLSPTSPTSPTTLLHLKTRSATDLRSSASPNTPPFEEYLLDSPKPSKIGEGNFRQPLSARSIDSNYSLPSATATSRRPKNLVLEGRSHSHTGGINSPSSEASNYSASPIMSSGRGAGGDDYAWHYASTSSRGGGVLESPNLLLDPTTIPSSSSSYGDQGKYDDVRESMISGTSTIQPGDEYWDPNDTTPIATKHRAERVLDPPTFRYDSPKRTGDSPVLPSLASPARQMTASTPKSKQVIEGSGSNPLSNRNDGSAKGEFGEGDSQSNMDDKTDTLKAIARVKKGQGTLPKDSGTSTPPIEPKGSDMLSPERPEYQRRTSSPGDKSPSLPPKSALRGPPSPASSRLNLAPSPQSVSPASKSTDLPSTTQSSVSSKPQVKTSSSKSANDGPGESSKDDTLDSANSVMSLAELQGMLDGAIGDMGLTDPREQTSVVSQPEYKPLPLANLEIPADKEKVVRAPQRKASLTSSLDSIPLKPTLETNNSNPSLTYQYASASPITPTAQPWPSAMLSGSIRNTKFPGDRAKAYAKAINEISRSESGLKEWCAAASMNSHRSEPRTRTSKQFSQVSLGNRTDSYSIGYGNSSTSLPRDRTVSAGSEFPMREDSYSAREIPQRTIDPQDQPTSLPSNLPYPQLQRTVGIGGGGMKPSPSMASMASTSSSKKGFFSAMRKNKKDSVVSLGPPQGFSTYNGSIPRRDNIRNLQISSPNPTSSSSPEVRTGNLPAPLGPRDPHRGSFTPPSGSLSNWNSNSDDQLPRGSLDTGLSRITGDSASARGSSFDSARSTPKSHMGPPTKSPLGDAISSRSSTPRDEDVTSMADILPHVEKSTLRAYLSKHGDAMRAIGAYLEDEKRGTVLKA